MRLLLFLFSLFLLQSCTILSIEKRRYNKGFSISSNRIKKTETPSADKEFKVSTDNTKEITNVSASSERNEGPKTSSNELTEKEDEIGFGTPQDQTGLEEAPPLVRHTEKKSLSIFEKEEHDSDVESDIAPITETSQHSEMEPFLRVVLIVLGSIGLTILAGIGIVLSYVAMRLIPGLGILIGIIGIYLSITVALYLFLLMITRRNKKRLFLKAALITLFGLLAVVILFFLIGLLL